MITAQSVSEQITQTWSIAATFVATLFGAGVGAAVAMYRTRKVEMPVSVSEIVERTLAGQQGLNDNLQAEVNRLKGIVDALREEVETLRLQNAEIHDLRNQVTALETALSTERSRHDSHHEAE